EARAVYLFRSSSRRPGQRHALNRTERGRQEAARQGDRRRAEDGRGLARWRRALRDQRTRPAPARCTHRRHAEEGEAARLRGERQGSHHGLAWHAGVLGAARAVALRSRAPWLGDDQAQSHAPPRSHAPRADREQPHGDHGQGRAQADHASRMSARGALSQIEQAPAALQQAWDMSGALLERTPDLVALFCAAEHSETSHDLAEALSDLAPNAAIIGACAADGVIGAGREHQGGPALGLLAATLPAGARVTPFHAQVGEGHEGPELVGLPAAPPGPPAVALADPHSTPVEQLIAGLGGVPLLGGFAGLGSHGAARLFTNGGCAEEGVVGIVLEGLPLSAIVSQGARPIGPDLVVTAAEGNLILELAGRPALERVRLVVEDLSLTERLLLENGLLIGLVVDENRPEHGLGDFLVRGVLGADSDTGALAVGDVPRVGPTVPPHLT